jgi:hypothetical protein
VRVPEGYSFPLVYEVIAFVGMENIKKTARKNKPMSSSEDPKTKGFVDGKFRVAYLEALLSLEDNFENLDRDGSLESISFVSQK